MAKINKELFKDVTLLYVEDDVMTLEEISFFLKKYVGKLIIAKNGKEGLEMFKEHRPDMIITDIQMPIMTGLEMASEIFKIDENVPIAVTTAYSDSEYLIKAIELGIDKYIIKPLDLSEILAVIQKSLHLTIKNEIYEDYIQFILDSNPTFMFVMNSEKIEFANKKFLELLGHKDIISFREQVEKCSNFIEIEGVETELSWIDYIMQNSDKKHLLKLNKKLGNFSREFYISYKSFESKNKSVFVFTDTNEEKLEQINEITRKLIKKLDNVGMNEIYSSELNQILKLSYKV